MLLTFFFIEINIVRIFTLKIAEIYEYGEAQAPPKHMSFLYASQYWHPSHNTAFRCTFALSMQNINSFLVLRCTKTSTKIGIYSLKFPKMIPLVFRNNFRILLGPKLQFSISWLNLNMRTKVQSEKNLDYLAF